MDSEPNLYDHLVTELEGTETPSGIGVGEATIRLKWGDDGETVEILEVLITPMGTGVGTRFVAALRSFCDTNGKELRIADATNPNFWRKFDWLAAGELEMDFKSSYSDGMAVEFWYTPESFLREADPRQR